MAIGEDGLVYTLDPGEPIGCYDHTEDAFDGERFACPLCFSEVQLIHSKKLRGGKRKRIMVQTVQNVGGYTCIFYWMIVRYIDEAGMDYVDTEPMDAYVLTEKGGLVHYTHARRNSFGTYTQRGDWYCTDRCKDYYDTPYGDWGSINNKKAGAVTYPEHIEMGGVTGEKTGLLEFMDAGGFALVDYLKFWRKHRSIENLVKCGQAWLVADIFRVAQSYCYSIEAEMKKYVDLTKCKPHEMLRISKAEFRYLRQNGIALRTETYERFQEYRNIGGKLSLGAFLEIAPDFGRYGLTAVFTIMRDTPADLDKIARYMAKQNLEMTNIQQLVDVRRMARSINGNPALSQEELWPRNLAAAHERLTQIQAEQRRLRDEAERKKNDGKFLEVIDKYGQLQWTDGELCIVLPKCSQDLHDEGRILRHCVGGYSNSHISGSDTIFFVRKYRRPERSYYTLDIRMNKGKPEEIQLHGYGNERHGKNKEHTHRIPQKVRSFVDRWENEVLLPWWVEQNKQKKEEKTA